MVPGGSATPASKPEITSSVSRTIAITPLPKSRLSAAQKSVGQGQQQDANVIQKLGSQEQHTKPMTQSQSGAVHSTAGDTSESQDSDDSINTRLLRKLIKLRLKSKARAVPSEGAHLTTQQAAVISSNSHHQAIDEQHHEQDLPVALGLMGPAPKRRMVPLLPARPTAGLIKGAQAPVQLVGTDALHTSPIKLLQQPVVNKPASSVGSSRTVVTKKLLSSSTVNNEWVWEPPKTKPSLMKKRPPKPSNLPTAMDSPQSAPIPPTETSLTMKSHSGCIHPAQPSVPLHPSMVPSGTALPAGQPDILLLARAIKPLPKQRLSATQKLFGQEHQGNDLIQKPRSQQQNSEPRTQSQSAEGRSTASSTSELQDSNDLNHKRGLDRLQQLRVVAEAMIRPGSRLSATSSQPVTAHAFESKDAGSANKGPFQRLRQETKKRGEYQQDLRVEHLLPQQTNDARTSHKRKVESPLSQTEVQGKLAKVNRQPSNTAKGEVSWLSERREGALRSKVVRHPATVSSRDGETMNRGL